MTYEIKYVLPEVVIQAAVKLCQERAAGHRKTLEHVRRKGGGEATARHIDRLEAAEREAKDCAFAIAHMELHGER